MIPSIDTVEEWRGHLETGSVLFAGLPSKNKAKEAWKEKMNAIAALSTSDLQNLTFLFLNVDTPREFVLALLAAKEIFC